MATLTSPTLGKLISNVRNFLNQPNAGNSFWTDLELTEYLNEAVRLYFTELSHSQEGFFTTKTNLNIVNGSETVALPTDCFVVKALRKKVNNGFEILSYQNDITQSYSIQGGTTSEAYMPYYFFRGNNLVLRPTPQFNETAGLELEYMQFPDVMTGAANSLTDQVAPIFKQLLEMYAVYKAKLKESLVNGVNMHAIPQQHVAELYQNFKDAIWYRSKNPVFTVPYNPEVL